MIMIDHEQVRLILLWNLRVRLRHTFENLNTRIDLHVYERSAPDVNTTLEPCSSYEKCIDGHKPGGRGGLHGTNNGCTRWSRVLH